MMPRLHRDFLSKPLAHRALHDVSDGRPENSLPAIRAAIDHGYGIEIDLQLSRDDQAMVFHDYDLDRLTDASGLVRVRTEQELSTLALKGGASPIPSLTEVLDLVSGRVPVLIELKDQDGAMGADVGPLERATALALKGYDGPVAVMSFNPHSVIAMAELAPDVPRGLTTSAYAPDIWPLPPKTCARLRDIPDYSRAGACFISHEVADLDRPRVAELKQAGADILCWTVKSPEAEADARRVAQNITFEGYLAPFPG